MTVLRVAQVQSEIRRLHEQLDHQERRAADKERQLERYAADLRETFKRERARAAELRRSYMATVRALANAVEARDAYTGKHAERVSAYGLVIGEAAGLRMGAAPEIEFGFLLHDVGKVAVPDAILFKPGPLTPEERLVMEQHSVTGWRIVGDIEFLGQARDVIRSHHERWDGSGYPDGLAGDGIPLAARVFAVADTLDALTSDRPYRAASTLAEARAIIEAAAGTQFDPAVVEAFMQLPDTTLDTLQRQIG